MRCRRNKLSHDGFKGRCKQTGFKSCGENVAYNTHGHPKLSSTPQDTHKRWMNSPGHRKNIKRESFTKVGYSYYKCTATNRIYWCGYFGS